MSEPSVVLRPARDDDLDAIAELVNDSYRGAGGWTNEAAFLRGLRTSPQALRRDLSDHPRAVLLVAGNGPTPAGVVRLEQLEEGAWELGMLAVRPSLQGGKIGRSVLEAGEFHALERGARCIEITVINIRESLIAWYGRRGYRETGEIRSFPYQGSPFGAPTRDDLAFVVMNKTCDRTLAGSLN